MSIPFLLRYGQSVPDAETICSPFDEEKVLDGMRFTIETFQTIEQIKACIASLPTGTVWAGYQWLLEDFQLIGKGTK